MLCVLDLQGVVLEVIPNGQGTGKEANEATKPGDGGDGLIFSASGYAAKRRENGSMSINSGNNT